MTWKVTQRNVWKYIANLRIKRLNKFSKSQHHAWMTINSKKKKMGSFVELFTVCSQIVLKCLHLARIGRPDKLWSVNKLARAITKWTKACCDKRLARLTSYIHHTCEFRQYCFVGNTAQQCRLGLFQDFDFCWRPWRHKINIRRNSVHFRKSHVCANKLDVQETDHTVLQKLKWFLSMQVYAWTVFPVSLSGIWGLKCFISYRTVQMDPRESHGETVGSCQAEHA